jgi:hypothetical protein
LGTPIEIGPFLIEYDDKPGANEEMTAAQFREIALSLPEAVEAAHMGHPDFRVGGRIFATLGYQNEGRGVLLLSPEEQQEMISQHPKMFEPVPGGWGRRGSTQVVLARITQPVLEAAMRKAWQRKAPKRLSKPRRVPR